MQILKSYAANLVRLKKVDFHCRVNGLSTFLAFQDSKADVPTNTEKTSKLAWHCFQIQFWLSLFLDVRLKVDSLTRKLAILTSASVNPPGKNLQQKLRRLN